MVRIIGVNFRNGGKIFCYAPGERDVKLGDKVVVETSCGMELGTVILGKRDVEEEKIEQPLKTILRIATEDDIRRVEENREKEKEAYRICREKIEKHGLEMKLISCEYAFDCKKILFYFTADGRIDFRELVKDLASVFRMRIELRQIGVRDETKMLGGIGICGRELCCKSFLSDFAPVSIRMAKEQNLSLNPTKISGTCGRLMCCLKNEEETYEYLNARLPVVGEFVINDKEGTKGKVYSVDVLRQTVKVVVSLPGDDLEVMEYPVDNLRFKERHRKQEVDENELTDEQLALEKELNKVKAEHAEAAAAAAVAQEKIAAEKAAHPVRKESTSLQQAIKAVRENEAAEKAERDEMLARAAARAGDDKQQGAAPGGEAVKGRQPESRQADYRQGSRQSSRDSFNDRDRRQGQKQRNYDRDSYQNRGGYQGRNDSTGGEGSQSRNGYQGRNDSAGSEGSQSHGTYQSRGGYQGRYDNVGGEGSQNRGTYQNRGGYQNRNTYQNREGAPGSNNIDGGESAQGSEVVQSRGGYQGRNDSTGGDGSQSRGSYQNRGGYQARDGYQSRNDNTNGDSAQGGEGTQPRSTYQNRNGYQPRGGYQNRSGYQNRDGGQSDGKNYRHDTHSRQKDYNRNYPRDYSRDDSRVSGRDFEHDDTHSSNYYQKRGSSDRKSGRPDEHSRNYRDDSRRYDNRNAESTPIRRSEGYHSQKRRTGIRSFGQRPQINDRRDDE